MVKDEHFGEIKVDHCGIKPCAYWYKNYFFYTDMPDQYQAKRDEIEWKVNQPVFSNGGEYIPESSCDCPSEQEGKIPKWNEEIKNWEWVDDDSQEKHLIITGTILYSGGIYSGCQDFTRNSLIKFVEPFTISR